MSSSSMVELIWGAIQETWRYFASGLIGPLMQAEDAQSLTLAVFILGLLSLTVVCLLKDLLGGGGGKEKEAEQQRGRGAVKRRYGGHSQGNATNRSGDVTFKCQSHHEGVGRSTRHRSKCWTTHGRHELVSSSLRRNNSRSGGEVIISYREIPRSQPSLSCRSCGLLPAKRKCSYKQCGACCRANKSSICSAHGTGDLAAMSLMEAACEDKFLELDLSYMNLKSCPQLIGYVGRQLTFLNLSNNRLVSLPEELGLLGGLEQLFLQYNCLEQLPKCIGNFSHLQELDCKNNHLRSLPDSLGSLSQLVILNVTNNLLSELPHSIGQLTLLEELCAHSNQLTGLPDEMCNLINLTALYIGENRLRRLPSAFGRLVRLSELDLSSCALDSLPASLSRCTSLNKVWISNNNVRYLPDQIGRLHQLKELHVRNNPLEFFPASLSYLQLYTFSVNQDRLLHEWDQEVKSQLTVEPDSNIPPLSELAARCTVTHRVRWRKGELPIKLEEMLESVRWCSCCEGPFFSYFKSELVFANIGIFHRVPLYQQVCSPFLNRHCQPVQWTPSQHPQGVEDV